MSFGQILGVKFYRLSTGVHEPCLEKIEVPSPKSLKPLDCSTTLYCPITIFARNWKRVHKSYIELVSNPAKPWDCHTVYNNIRLIVSKYIFHVFYTLAVVCYERNLSSWNVTWRNIANCCCHWTKSWNGNRTTTQQSWLASSLFCLRKFVEQ